MVKIVGAKAHKARIRKLAGTEMVREVGKAVYVAADKLAAEAALSITNGAVSGKNHVPSKPGEPPNADTHFLDRSIHVEAVTPLQANVVADAPYAARLELGDSRVAARPYMEPAARKTRKPAQNLVGEAVRRVSRGQTL